PCTRRRLFAERFRRSATLALVEKAAVVAGTTTDVTWAGPLAAPQPLADALLELVRPATIVGRLPLRRVPPNVSVSVQTGGGTYAWTAENSLKKVTKMAFGTVTLGPAKCSGIVTVTSELMKLSVPNAEAALREEIAS